MSPTKTIRSRIEAEISATRDRGGSADFLSLLVGLIRIWLETDVYLQIAATSASGSIRLARPPQSLPAALS
jgi:hypothetical protein